MILLQSNDYYLWFLYTNLHILTYKSSKSVGDLYKQLKLFDEYQSVFHIVKLGLVVWITLDVSFRVYFSL